MAGVREVRGMMKEGLQEMRRSSNAQLQMKKKGS
jgi:hypothetical protein